MTLNPDKDIRVAATSKIWGFATAMLALCIPLSAVTRSGAILPLAVISGAAIGTVKVWRSDQESQNNPLLKNNNIQQLEQRVADLETIISSQELDFQRKIKQLQSND